MTQHHASASKARHIAGIGLLLASIVSVAAHAQTKPLVTVINPETNPVNARITNSVIAVEVSNADPLPVTIAASPSAAVVECGLFTGSGAVSPDEFIDTTSLTPLANVTCRNGATVVDVQRILISLHETGGTGSSDNVATFNARVGYADGSTGVQTLAVLSDGAPDAVVARPFRLDRGGPGSIVVDATASSGITGLNPKFSARLIFIGTVVE